MTLNVIFVIRNDSDQSIFSLELGLQTTNFTEKYILYKYIIFPKRFQTKYYLILTNNFE